MGIINSIINIASNNVFNILYFYFLLLIFAYPLGIFVRKLSSIKLERWFLFDISCGISILSVLYYCSILLRINFLIFTILVLVLNILVLWRNLNFSISSANKLVNWSRYKCLVWLILLFLFLYYLIPALMIDYGFARDYDVFALGIKQTSDFVLPFYNIEDYYPPLVSVLTVFFSNLINLMNINKLMMFIFPFIALLIYNLFCLIGEFSFNNKKLGLCFLISSMIIATLKNAVIGGSTYSFLLATHFFLLFIIFFFKYLESKNTQQLIFSGLFSAGILLSHADIFIVFLWFCLALFISRLILFNKKHTIMCFLSVALIGLFVASPYLYYALTNSKNVSNFWTEQMWVDKINGESKAKDINQVLHFVGRISFSFGIIGLLFLYLIKIEKWLKLTLFLTTLFLYFQNHQFIHYLVKPILHIYPLNIIMWTGLTIPLILLSGMGVYYISTKINVKYQKYYLFGFLVLSLVLFIDYETINIQNIYRPGSGLLIAGLSNRNNAISSGDLFSLNFIRQQNFTGKVMNMDNFPGYLAPVYAEKSSQLLFYEESYHDLRKWSFMDKLTNESLTFFNNPSLNEVENIINNNDISFIYLPSTASTNTNQYFNYSTKIFDRFSILYRKDGAKILDVKKNDNKKIIHLEAEDWIDNQELVQDYVYGKTIGIKTIKLPLNKKISFAINNTNLKNNESIIYIKHLTFWESLKINLVIGNYTKEVTTTSNKLEFSETIINMSTELFKNPIEIYSIVDDVNFVGKKIIPEIDWIEVEN